MGRPIVPGVLVRCPGCGRAARWSVRVAEARIDRLCNSCTVRMRHALRLGRLPVFRRCREPDLLNAGIAGLSPEKEISP